MKPDIEQVAKTMEKIEGFLEMSTSARGGGISYCSRI
jgi:hypothetical protein